MEFGCDSFLCASTVDDFKTMSRKNNFYLNDDIFKMH